MDKTIVENESERKCARCLRSKFIDLFPAFAVREREVNNACKTLILINTGSQGPTSTTEQKTILTYLNEMFNERIDQNWMKYKLNGMDKQFSIVEHCVV